MTLERNSLATTASRTAWGQKSKSSLFQKGTQFQREGASYVEQQIGLAKGNVSVRNDSARKFGVAFLTCHHGQREEATVVEECP